MYQAWNGKAAPIEEWEVRFKKLHFTSCDVLLCKVFLGNEKDYQTIKVEREVFPGFGYLDTPGWVEVLSEVWKYLENIIRPVLLAFSWSVDSLRTKYEAEATKLPQMRVVYTYCEYSKSKAHKYYLEW
jgi:hypothetical protein